MNICVGNKIWKLVDETTNFVLQKSSSILKKKIFFRKKNSTKNVFLEEKKKRDTVGVKITNLYIKISNEWHSLFSIIISLRQEKKCPNQYKQIFCADYELFYCRRNYLIFIFLCVASNVTTIKQISFSMFSKYFVTYSWSGLKWTRVLSYVAVVLFNSPSTVQVLCYKTKVTDAKI